MYNAWGYMQDTLNVALMTAADYPYTSGNRKVANCAYVSGQGFVSTVNKLGGPSGYYFEP